MQKVWLIICMEQVQHPSVTITKELKLSLRQEVRLIHKMNLMAAK